ncbi:MAG: acyl-CoA dehydrogenase family protein [Proteobacteria bacterium]|nr:acyl-CoA dehydrogenase family protein [Pseudomonadota bacterium]
MVDFIIDETQRQLADTARRFALEVMRPAEVELDRLADPDSVFDDPRFREVLARAYQLGFHKMALPEAYGGLGLDPMTLALIWEELAAGGPGFTAGLLPLAVVARVIAFIAPDNRDLVERYVIPFCEDESGTRIGAWGSSEPEVGSDGSNYYDPRVRHQTIAVKKGDRYVINGAKSSFVSNGRIASVYLVFACLDPSLGIRGSGAFIVPADSPGVATGRSLDKIGLRVLNQAAVYFEDVEVPENHLIFPPGDDYPFFHNAIVTVGNIGVGYLAVGLLRSAYEEALRYAKQRVQWGRPIARHQLITAKLFDAYTAIETARALLWKASWLSAQNFPGDLALSLTAKVYATRQAVRHTAEMVQVLGSYGISREYLLEKMMRDAKPLEMMDGANEVLALKAAAELIGDE